MSKRSIYKSPEGEAELMAIYDRLLENLGLEFSDCMVDTRFGATHVLVTGPEGAPPLVIFHGGNSVNPQGLVGFLPLLRAKEYRVYAPDTIGHPGRSAQTRLSPKDNSYGQWAADILVGLGVERVAVIGPSFGGGILMRLAAYAPERISRAVLFVPAGIVTPPIGSMIFKIVLPMLLYLLFPSHERLVHAVEWMSPEVDDDTLQLVGAVFHHVRIEPEMPRSATKEELAQFKAPTLLIAAEKDVLFPGHAVLRRAKEIIPNLVAAESLDGGTHYSSKRDLKYVNERIRKFLKESR